MKVALDLHAVWRGPLTGSLSFVLRPGTVDLKPGAIVKDISGLIGELNIKSPMVEVEQELIEDEQIERDLIRLVQSLKENDLYVVSHSDGQTLPLVVKEASYRIVHLHDTEWLAFPVNEIRFYPEKTFEEPMMPSKMAPGGTHMFICPIPEVTNPKDVVAFLKRSHYQWKVLTSRPWVLKQGG